MLIIIVIITIVINYFGLWSEASVQISKESIVCANEGETFKKKTNNFNVSESNSTPLRLNEFWPEIT